MMKKVLRVYDNKDIYTNTGECYFLVMPDEYDNDYEEEIDLERRLTQISGLGWQNYNEYITGIAEIDEHEEFWSALANYDLKEVKIDISRVEITGRYKLPEYLR